MLRCCSNTTWKPLTLRPCSCGIQIHITTKPQARKCFSSAGACVIGGGFIHARDYCPYFFPHVTIERHIWHANTHICFLINNDVLALLLLHISLKEVQCLCHGLTAAMQHNHETLGARMKPHLCKRESFQRVSCGIGSLHLSYAAPAQMRKTTRGFCGKLNSETGSVHLNPGHLRQAKDGAALVNCSPTRKEPGKNKKTHTRSQAH